jgi:hypothetical protein
MSEEARIPEQATHHLKLEETAKGGRIHVSVYATSKKAAIKELFETYDEAKKEAVRYKIPLAPMEVSK